MPTFLFNEIIFGPVKSRRLGVSLGINLLPLESKLCNFDCIYCECGRTFKPKAGQKKFHTREEVKSALQMKLAQMKKDGIPPDVITYAGNGEPTMHPEFPGIIDDTIELRNYYFPESRIAVLSNATMIHKKSVRDALMRIEQNILKMDSGIEKTIRFLNNPAKNFTLKKLIETLLLFQGNFILQTMFVQGEHEGEPVDNTTEIEINSWIEILKVIKPREIMIYTIDRDTPSPGLKKVSLQKLNEIADVAKQFGFSVEISA